MFLLVGWPAELFNKTVEENEATIRRWLGLRPLRERVRRRGVAPLVVVFSVLAALVMSVAEPGPFLNRRVLVVAAALLVAVPLSAVTFEWAIESYARRVDRAADRSRLHVVFPAVAVAFGCAISSRLLHFVPGYAYGLIIAYPAVRGRVLLRSQEAAGVFRAVVALLLLGGTAWVAWQFGTSGPAASDGAGLPLRLLDTTLAFIALLCLETLLICLLPLRFMPGAKLWQWAPRSRPDSDSRVTWRGRLLWLCTHTVVATAFVIVLLGVGERTPSWPEVITMLTLLVAFCICSLTFWAIFRFRRSTQPDSATGVSLAEST
jgi:hypothetical protein